MQLQDPANSKSFTDLICLLITRNTKETPNQASPLAYKGAYFSLLSNKTHPPMIIDADNDRKHRPHSMDNNLSTGLKRQLHW
jgi:hypothetical protein